MLTNPEMSSSNPAGFVSSDYGAKRITVIQTTKKKQKLKLNSPSVLLKGKAAPLRGNT